MKNYLLMIGTTLVCLSSNAVTVPDVKCTVTESAKEISYVVKNPVGGGSSFEHKMKNGKKLSIVVMMEQNEDNSNAFNMTLLPSISGEKLPTILSAKGLIENKYLENGLSFSYVISKKSGEDLDSLETVLDINCKL